MYLNIIIKDKYYDKKSLVNGAGNKNRFVFQGKGIADEMGHHKFYVDMKLLNKSLMISFSLILIIELITIYNFNTNTFMK